MRRVLLAGVGPLPSPGAERVFAPGLRLDAFIHLATSTGMRVYVAEMEFAGGNARHFTPRSGVDAHRLFEGKPGEHSHQLAHWIADIDPEIVVTTTDAAALSIVRTGYTGPLYVDYNGHPMAERQQLSAVHKSNASLAEQWLAVLPVLLRADRFAVCTAAQRLALIGELGAAGRLNAETAGYEFVDVMPPTIPFPDALPKPSPELLAKYAIPESARIVLSTGGFNTWVDGETLYHALESLLRQEPEVHFVCTGGAIEGHVTRVFEEFQRHIQRSSFRNRVHFLGWIPHEELLELMQRCHVAVNCDLPVLEGELGFRNRILGWLWCGMRVVTTVTASPARELVQQGLARGVPVRDSEALAAALAEEATKDRPHDLKGIHAALEKGWGRERSLQPLATWLESPIVAPDRLTGAESNPLKELQMQFLTLAEHVQNEKNIRHTARTAGKRLLGSRIVRMYCTLYPEMQEILEELAEL